MTLSAMTALCVCVSVQLLYILGVYSAGANSASIFQVGMHEWCWGCLVVESVGGMHLCLDTNMHFCCAAECHSCVGRIADHHHMRGEVSLQQGRHTLLDSLARSSVVRTFAPSPVVYLRPVAGDPFCSRYCSRK